MNDNDIKSDYPPYSLPTNPLPPSDYPTANPANSSNIPSTDYPPPPSSFPAVSQNNQLYQQQSSALIESKNPLSQSQSYSNVGNVVNLNPVEVPSEVIEEQSSCCNCCCDDYYCREDLNMKCSERCCVIFLTVCLYLGFVIVLVMGIAAMALYSPEIGTMWMFFFIAVILLFIAFILSFSLWFILFINNNNNNHH
jgi:hypothetical protein